MRGTLRELRRFRDEQALISIRRDRFGGDGIHGFVLHVSDELLLVQNVYDFHIDGLFLIRINDITGIKMTATDELHRKLLIDEGEFEKVDFGCRPPIRSYDTFLKSLPENRVVILEDEESENSVFLIGTLICVDETEVLLRFFDGAGQWEDEPSIIGIARISKCQIKTNYAEFYARYFARIGDL